ncbi:MAG TPA: hypothetical protein DCQ06_02890 [Myxococcales bacterium]|nr:hypothetical protein [Myxococcales bacterium]
MAQAEAQLRREAEPLEGVWMGAFAAQGEWLLQRPLVVSGQRGPPGGDAPDDGERAASAPWRCGHTEHSIGVCSV